MDKLRQYETFSSVDQMDEHISKVLAHFELSKNERELLWLLSGHSVKFVGVSFLKLDSMAKALEVSKKTIQRALKSLSDLGIIKRIRTIRPVRGGFGASLTLICPVELTTREEATEPTPERPQEQSGSKETFSFKAFSKDIKYIRQQEIDYSFLTEFVPSEFIRVVKPFVSPEEAYSLWGKAQVCAKRYAPAVMDIIEPAVRAFKASVTAYKFNRIQKSFGAYFWGSLSGVFAHEQRKRVSGSNLISWFKDNNDYCK